MVDDDNPNVVMNIPLKKRKVILSTLEKDDRNRIDSSIQKGNENVFVKPVTEEPVVSVVEKDSTEDHTETEFLRNERLKVNEQFSTGYNNGDFDSLYQLMTNVCDEQMTFKYPELQIDTVGVIPLLTFFMLVNEYYPDSMVKPVERRIATVKLPKSLSSSGVMNLKESEKTYSSGPSDPLVAPFDLRSSSSTPTTVTPPSSSSSSSSASATPLTDATPLTETIEIIDKFVGTRVIEKPLIVVFRELINESLLLPSLTVTNISDLLNNKLTDRLTPKQEYTSNDKYAPLYENKKFYSILTETKLTFSLKTNKITHWNYSILAVHSTTENKSLK
jgi:hypothetical protein